MTDTTLSEFYCLKDGRTNFDLDPATDSSFLFGEPEWAADVDKKLKRSQMMGRPFRIVWWGQYGIGKTHRLRFTKRLIEENGYDYFPCYAVASDLDDKSGFERLHIQLVSAIGYDRMRTFAEKYILRLHNNEDVRTVEDLADPESDVASAVLNLGSKNPAIAAAAWRYLSGQKLERQDMALAGTSKLGIDTANEFAAVYNVFSHMIEKETGGKKLLFLIDEVENLTKVRNKNAASRWQESIRSLLDVKSLGLVFAVGAENFQGVPAIMIMPDIVRRIQNENYEPMAAYKASTAEKFVKNLLKELIDPDCRTALEEANGWSDGVKDYESELYPFTKTAFGIFCGHATVDPKNAKPSEILNALNNAAYEAVLENSRLITPDILHNLKMS